MQLRLQTSRMNVEAVRRNSVPAIVENILTMSMIEETPWNACDRRCERCPLSAGCRLYASDTEAREDARARGLDADDPTVTIQLAGESLAKALELATRAAEEIGISTERLGPAPEPADAGSAFAAAGRAYCIAAYEIAKPSPPSALIREATFVAYLVAAKTARLTFGLPLRLDDPARDHTAFNLLLIDTLLRQAQALFALMGLALHRFEPLEREAVELRRLLEVHLQAVGLEDRRVLMELIRAGRAPSPFCVTTQRTDASA